MGFFQSFLTPLSQVLTASVHCKVLFQLKGESYTDHWIIIVSTHIKDIEIVVNEVFYNLHFMLSFSICLKEAWGKQQRKVLCAHLIQVSTLLYPERGGYTKKNVFLWWEKYFFLQTTSDQHDYSLNLGEYILEYLTCIGDWREQPKWCGWLAANHGLALYICPISASY